MLLWNERNTPAQHRISQTSPTLSPCSSCRTSMSFLPHQTQTPGEKKPGEQIKPITTSHHMFFLFSFFKYRYIFLSLSAFKGTLVWMWHIMTDSSQRENQNRSVCFTFFFFFKCGSSCTNCTQKSRRITSSWILFLSLIGESILISKLINPKREQVFNKGKISFHRNNWAMKNSISFDTWWRGRIITASISILIN